eukprot:c19476_g1_i1 orf=335-1387(+)
MELENRTEQDMSATAANADLPHMNSSACMAPFHGLQASPDLRIHAFANQQQALSVDMRMHTFANQEHTSCADMRIHELATQRQPACPITPHGQVMTDEQMETLRRQISVYATICQQLVEMHKAIVAQGSATGMWLGPSIPFDSSLHHIGIGHKLTSRQRWTPSQTQLHILERLFEQESGTPNKQRIKEITTELSQHGQISETNVYNWFQNRRARTKRKQQLGGPNNGDSEHDTDVDLPEEKKSKTVGDFTNDTFDAAQTSRACVGADAIELHQGLSKYSQSHVHSDSPAVSFKADAYNGHGAMQANALVDNKLWDLPLDLPESKTDFIRFSASQEFQGRQMIISGAESRH